MSSVIYKLTSLGVSQRGGMNAAVEASIGGVAKTNAASKFTIANEVIAARVGQALGLPVPAGVIAEDEDKNLYYLSLDVSREGKQLPPVFPEEFCQEEPWFAAGTIVFDVLIANEDRNSGNLSRDPAFNPPRVSIFDHGHALFGTNAPTGPDRLNALTDQLGCGNSALLDQDVDAGRLELWATRVRELPSYVFDDVCGEVARTPALNVGQDDANALAAWLASRAAGVGDLICDNQGAFPAVNWALWGP